MRRLQQRPVRSARAAAIAKNLALRYLPYKYVYYITVVIDTVDQYVLVVLGHSAVHFQLVLRIAFVTQTGTAIELEFLLEVLVSGLVAEPHSTVSDALLLKN